MESFLITLEKMIGKLETKTMVDKGFIEARPLAYMRGSTFDRSIMVLDEAQNCDLRQLILFVTRMGETSKVIICGDVEQYDIAKNQSGLNDFIKILNGIKGATQFNFEREDIVRSKILIELTDSYNKWKLKNNKI
jgi:phosphate starvation-inducible PhoH-like protein